MSWWDVQISTRYEDRSQITSMQGSIMIHLIPRSHGTMSVGKTATHFFCAMVKWRDWFPSSNSSESQWGWSCWGWHDPPEFLPVLVLVLLGLLGLKGMFQWIAFSGNIRTLETMVLSYHHEVQNWRITWVCSWAFKKMAGLWGYHPSSLCFAPDQIGKLIAWYRFDHDCICPTFETSSLQTFSMVLSLSD